MGVNLLALAWGLAEATLFFLVPDILLSLVALRERRAALAACAYAVAGALAGGAVMYLWGARDAAAAILWLDRVPAVGPAMIEAVGRQLRTAGLWALMWGPATGTPYKIYAVQAPAAGVGLPAFLAASVPARLLRFAAVALGIGWVGARLPRGWSLSRKRALVLAGWLLFYVGYFSLVTG